MWDDNVAQLAEKFRVVRFSFRGAGASPLDGNFSIDDLADDALRVLDGLKIPLAAIVGLSMGGYVALAFARRHAARMSALVLVDTKAAADSDAAKAMRDQGVQLIEQYGARAFAATVPERLLAPSANAVLRERVREMAVQPDAGMITALKAMRARPDRTRELSLIRCPTLCVVGENDILTPPEEAHAMAARIPGARVHVIPHVGHMSNLEAPTEFNTVLLDFLSTELLAR